MLSNEPIINHVDWKRLEGTTLEAGYELRDLVSASAERATFRARVLGGAGQVALVNFYAAGKKVAEAQLEIWQALRALRDETSLSVPLDARVLELDGVVLVYAVLTKAEERLSEVLAERALTAAEAREILDSLIPGLEALHRNGFAHGCLSPNEVLANSDSIALATESVRRVNDLPVLEEVQPKYLAPESSVQNSTIAADVWCLGATLFEAQTQRTYKWTDRAEVQKMEESIGRAIGCCLEADPKLRCSLDDLRKPLPKPKVAAVQPVIQAVPVAMPIVVAEPAKVLQPPIKDESSAVFEGRRRAELPNAAKAGRRTWIYVVGAAIACLLVFWLLRPKAKPVQSVSRDVTTTTQATSTMAPGKAWPTKTLTPDTKPAKAIVQAMKSGETVWRVVLYTYRREQDAEHKAKTLNGRNLGFTAELFSPSGKSSPYLVTVGRYGSRQEAVKVREKALREGMPRDTYVQNYKR